MRSTPEWPRPIFAGRIALAHQHGQQGIVTELVVIVELHAPSSVAFSVAQAQPVHSLGDQFLDGMLDPVRMAVIGETARELADDAGDPSPIGLLLGRFHRPSISHRRQWSIIGKIKPSHPQKPALPDAPEDDDMTINRERLPISDEKEGRHSDFSSGVVGDGTVLVRATHEGWRCIDPALALGVQTALRRSASAIPRDRSITWPPPITPHVLWGETGDSVHPCRLVGRGGGRGARPPRKSCSTWNNAIAKMWHDPSVPEPFVAMWLRGFVPWLLIRQSTIDIRQSLRGVPRSCPCHSRLAAP